MKTRALSLLILIGGILAIISLSSSIRSLLKKDDLFIQKEDKLEELKEKNFQLEQVLEKVQSKEFIEKEAREKLSMGKDGEIVVILPKTPKIQNSKNPKQEELANWKKWYNLFFY
ncbi:septum formation initiator family protein [Candidatus Microgenomates bacterium]|nr:septum formation initiator family protein [Candidatus Microgenomates bacterium]